MRQRVRKPNGGETFALILLCMTILTAWWTLQQAAAPGRRPAVTQAIVSTGAFAVWVFALGGPFEHVPGQKLYGSLLLILYTLVAALVDPRES